MLHNVLVEMHGVCMSIHTPMGAIVCLCSESFASGLRACFPDAVGLPGVPAATAAVGCPYVGTNASVLAEALQQALSQDQAAKDAVCAVAVRLLGLRSTHCISLCVSPPHIF